MSDEAQGQDIGSEGGSGLPHPDPSQNEQTSSAPAETSSISQDVPQQPGPSDVAEPVTNADGITPAAEQLGHVQGGSVQSNTKTHNPFELAEQLPGSFVARKKPVPVLVVECEPGTVSVIEKIAGKKLQVEEDGVIIPTLEGDMKAKFGDLIIRGVQGEVYPCKASIFAATYEDAQTPPQPGQSDIASPENVKVMAIGSVHPSDIITVYVENPDGDRYGGAHVYRCVPSLGFENGAPLYDGIAPTIVVPFVHKPFDGGPTVPGLQSEQLLLILKDRHTKLNAVFSSKYHRQFIEGIELAIDALRRRVNDRIAAGTMGKLKQ